MTNAEPAQMGHNNPPSDVEILKAKLTEANAEAIAYAEKLIAKADVIPQDLDDETSQKVTDYEDLCKKVIKNMEATRTKEKEPFLSQGRVVDSFFGDIMDRVKAAKNKANVIQTKYLQKKAAAEKAERDRIAKEQAEEAARLKKLADEEAAKNAPQAEAIQQAAASQQQVAEKAEKAANVKASAMAVSRGSSTGARSSLRTEWVGTLTDQATVDLETLRHHLSPADIQKAINSYVRAGGRDLAGAEIKEVTTAVTR